jgi:predicted dehydrogenase
VVKLIDIMEAFKWGIIGPGSIARDFIDDLKHVKEPQTVQAVTGRREEKTRKFAEEFKVPQYFTDLEKFLHETKIDGVYIATPHSLHYEEVIACLNRKIPVLCEKPMAINKEQIGKMIACAKENGTFLMEGMWIRFLPSIRKVLEIVQSGKIGNIVTIRASLTYKAPKDDNNRYFNPDLAGGSLLDLGVYPVFLSQLLLGKPDSIKAFARLSDDGIDETCSALLQYAGRATSIIDCSFITENEAVADILGDKGMIRIASPWNEKPAGIRLTVYKQVGRDDDEVTEHSCEWPGRGFQYEVEEMLDCIDRKQIESKQLSHQLSLDLMDTMDTIRNQVGIRYEKFE